MQPLHQRLVLPDDDQLGLLTLMWTVEKPRLLDATQDPTVVTRFKLRPATCMKANE
jgi:hypothetical protein